MPKAAEKEAPKKFCQARNCINSDVVASLLGPDGEEHDLCEGHYKVVLDRLVRAPWAPLEEVLHR